MDALYSFVFGETTPSKPAVKKAPPAYAMPSLTLKKLALGYAAFLVVVICVRFFSD